MLGITHAELSATVLRCVGLPEVVRAPIDAFHSGRRAEARGAHPLARVLRLADWYANGLLLASGSESPVGPFEAALCHEAVGEKNPPCPDGDALRSEVFGLTAALGRLPAIEEARVLAPPHRKRDVPVWLARAATFSSFDPVAAALGSLADVHVSPALPSAAEAPNYRAVIIVAPGPDTPGYRAADVEQLHQGPTPPAILWLAGHADLPVSTDGGSNSPVCSRWPVSIARLAEFVAKL